MSILSEALPYLQKFRDKIVVVKYGGAAMKDPTLKVGCFLRRPQLLVFEQPAVDSGPSSRGRSCPLQLIQPDKHTMGLLPESLAVQVFLYA